MNGELLIPLEATTLAFEEAALKLHPDDDVAIAKLTLAAGTTLRDVPGADCPVRTAQAIPVGHKFALRPLAPGQPIRRYGQVIGFARQAIQAGDHVHVHNCGVADFERDYAFGVDVKPVSVLPVAQRRTFMGYPRPDGRAGTRNYVAVISTVNCSAHVVRAIARAFTKETLADFPNVDGVIAIAHGLGCAVRVGSEDYVLLQRVLAGMAITPTSGATSSSGWAAR